MPNQRQRGRVDGRTLAPLMAPFLATVFAFLLATTAADAKTSAGSLEALREGLQKRISSTRGAASEVSVHIVDVDTGIPVVNHEANRGRIIASNTKLFTTAAALDRLGPGYRLETWLLMRGRVADGILEGDLAVVGGGDPNLSGRHYDGDSYAAFRPWAATLRRLGVHRVAGEVILVDGLFNGPRVHPDWPRDQLSQWYEAPTAALSFNDNCVLVRVWPGTAPGAPPRVEMVPSLDLFTVRSTARTAAARSSRNVRIERTPGTSALTISGSLPVGGRPIERWITVEDPVLYFGEALKAAFAEEGVALGRIQRSRSLPLGLNPQGSDGGRPWRRVASSSMDLLTTVDVINKRSQNFYAESLIKILGARVCGQGSWAKGLEVVRELLDEVGLDRGSYSQADGSGMSRGNRFTARQITTLLRYMFYHRWGKEFIQSLAYSGEPDLGWRSRLADPPYRGNVFAKTGTLRGVSTLSGYVKATSGRLYAFSILLNGVRSDDAARRAQDALLRTLVDEG